MFLDGLRQRFLSVNLRKDNKDSPYANTTNNLPSILAKFKYLIHINHRIVSFFDVYIAILAIES